jgi:hypothetical protein
MPKPSTTLEPLAAHRWACALAAGLWFAAGPARGANIDITTHDVVAAAGASADLVFDFDFGTGTGVTSFNVSVDYDKSLLALDLAQSGATYHGAPVDPQASFGADYTVNLADPNGFSAAWLPLALPSPVPTFAGQAEVSLVYRLLPALTPGRDTLVTLSFAYSDQNADDGLVNSLPFSPVTSRLTASAQAVPEPQSSVLALVGMAVLVLRRRPRQHRP